ncbi:probable tRNA (uracil-O(2)-)-methyltransferase [Neocloeon triangulifer]|uniref:probable tRNA (uracil-O(2)-)-methyltransferase n=1 Tax=Neocloeon triangulifer TaxID=2078957 RepID=UPI00286EEA92|nr:probable tRNA (uracil-O(2)-)-methyltransferase [Neocloeon triangulifer]
MTSAFDCFEVVESNEQPLDDSLTAENFWQGVSVWLSNPHVVNRRLFGCKIISSGHLPKCSRLDVSRFVGHCVVKEWVSSDLTPLVSEFLGQKDELKEGFNTGKLNPQPELNVIFLVRQLLSKTDSKTAEANRDVIFIDFTNNEATFVPFFEDGDTMQTKLPYKFQGVFSPGLRIKFLVYSRRPALDLSENWLRTTLFPRVVKWISAKPKEKSTIPTGSLTLVDLDKYNATYNRLKLKFGPYFVKIWTEQTDPLKFVYEDLAIASYLLCLWNCNPGDVGPSFVDLGCGNGLLVHVLNEEGCRGLGLDLRSRKIWAVYPETTKLEVSTVIPSPDTIYSNFDWLIGNHSDELTPWIPVLAAQSSPNCNFFLLPCCPFDFYGKYQRKDSSNSQYTEYIGYISSVGENCGFDMKIDKLRIPSTKRTCLIGRNKSACISKDLLWEFVNSTKACTIFNPRPAEEKVRNCTKLPKELIESVVQMVTQKMFEKVKEGKWQVEGGLSMADAAKLVPDEMKSQMKKEFGGLQTLLRNNHSIFQVQGGVIKFRLPKLNLELKNTNKWKNRPCWFFSNHPHGCPLQDDDCSFKHV